MKTLENIKPHEQDSTLCERNHTEYAGRNYLKIYKNWQYTTLPEIPLRASLNSRNAGCLESGSNVFSTLYSYTWNSSTLIAETDSLLPILSNIRLVARYLAMALSSIANLASCALKCRVVPEAKEGSMWDNGFLEGTVSIMPFESYCSDNH